MEQKIRFVVAAMQEVSWPEMIQRWQLLEASGLDGIMLADHFVNFASPKAHWYESWTLLAALATQTKTVRIGHPSGTISIEVDVANTEVGPDLKLAAFGRTSRRIMEGFVYVPERIFQTK